MKPIQKVAELEHNLREMFKRQQHELMAGGYVRPIKTEDKDSSPEYPSLSRKNVAIFDEQQFEIPTPTMATPNFTNRKPGKTDSSNMKDLIQADPEIGQLKATINKYEIMVYNLMQKLRSERESYKSAMKDLNKTNENLRSDLVKLAETFKSMNEKRKEEQRDLQKYRDDAETLLEKNQQLEHDLAKMVENVQSSDALLNDMNRKLERKQQLTENLSTEKSHLQQQIQMLQRDISRFSEDKQTSIASGDQKPSLSAPSWKDQIFGSTIGKILASSFILVFAMSFMMRSSDAAFPFTEDCDYDSEIFF